jgi:1-acyl-sn-glycerol-3-phosphate acyltransferase
MGWRIGLKLPADVPKYIVLVVPHTSNWDFFMGVLARRFLGLSDCKFLIKSEYFKPPFRVLMKRLGGIPVYRNQNTGLVEQVVEQFSRHEKMGIAITPEGTRSLNPNWKTGFYHIALQAGIPLVLGHIDYFRKEIGLGKVFYPTGDKEKDLNQIKEYYRHIIPRHLSKSSLEHIIPEKKNSPIPPK